MNRVSPIAIANLVIVIRLMHPTVTSHSGSVAGRPGMSLVQLRIDFWICCGHGDFHPIKRLNSRAT